MTMTSTGIDTTYNGWANYETWNVALYIGNDYSLYTMAKETAEAGGTYDDFAESLKECGAYITPDGVSWTHPTLDTEELDEMLNELVD